MTDRGGLAYRIVGEPREFARGVLSNVLANLIAAAIVYLLAITAGLLPPSKWLTGIALFVLASIPYALVNLVMPRLGHKGLQNVVRGFLVLLAGAALLIVVRPWLAGDGWASRIWQGLGGVALLAAVIVVWVLQARSRLNLAAMGWSGDGRRRRRGRLPGMTWYAVAGGDASPTTDAGVGEGQVVTARPL